MTKKGNFLLDLDQTLISAEATEEIDLKNEKVKEKAKKFVFKNLEDYYIVFERPNLQEFLTFLFANFNVSVWTAASKDYALFIIEHIILKGHLERKLDYIFFDLHGSYSNALGKCSKDLSLLWDIYKLNNYKPDNSLILDDYDDVYKKQPKNALIAKPFEFNDNDSPNDHFFKDLIPKLKVLKDNLDKGQGIETQITVINNETKEGMKKK